ncbi:ATP-binding cassette domain-containing protein [Azospirillum sp. B506]|uniref:ATP-binding cassette domain-containing protein n=1 Tax=Azospirillum sp. B506 TaxID=137721 RepID=UPI00034DE50F|nr:ATP-binding cassette domain-containing protein [Azospirillum sp. B506]
MAPPAPITALQGVSVTFGGRPLFDGIDLSIGRGDRACLVGRNGSGKSTLMKVLAGMIHPDGGTVFVQPGARIAYLPQEPDFTGCATVHDYVVQGLPADEQDEAHRVDAVLDRLQVDGNLDPRTLSGGESRRTALARTLVGNPDVMLLDEPTNHLDLPTIEWLEEELLAFRGGLLLISHDRAFLNRLAKRTLWLDRGTVRATDRGFAEFETWQAEVFEAEDAAAHKLDRKIESEMKWLPRGHLLQAHPQHGPCPQPAGPACRPRLTDQGLTACEARHLHSLARRPAGDRRRPPSPRASTRPRAARPSSGTSLPAFCAATGWG